MRSLRRVRRLCAVWRLRGVGTSLDLCKRGALSRERHLGLGDRFAKEVCGRHPSVLPPRDKRDMAGHLSRMSRQKAVEKRDRRDNML